MPCIVTRFAPSPTGALHIGGARTALYNWAFARQHGGKFLLRLEDTDRKRSTPQATLGILADLHWLGLNWDEGPLFDPAAPDADPLLHQQGDHGPYFQSQRLAIYQQYAQELLSKGVAYEDDGAVRFRQSSDMAYEDLVYGPIAWKAADLEDFVIMKADGFPTYHFAVVVDDHLMQVTHVIRGQEHTTNTAKHLALFDALGFARPTFAHTPSIMNPDGSKMSKRDKAKAARARLLDQAATANMTAEDFIRHYWQRDWREWSLSRAVRGSGGVSIDAEQVIAFAAKENDDLDITHGLAGFFALALPEINVADFKKSGYLPATLLNYIALLGWNPGNDVERFDLAFMVEHFSLDRVNKSNARFDRTKLLAFNQTDIAAMAPEMFQQTMADYDRAFGAAHFHNRFADQWPLFCAAFQPRLQTLGDITAQAGFLTCLDQQIQPDLQDKNIHKALLKGEPGQRGIDCLQAFTGHLEALGETDFGTAAHDAIKTHCEAQQISMGKIAQPIRIAISGTTVTPPIDQTLNLLGKQATLDRVIRLITHAI